MPLVRGCRAITPYIYSSLHTWTTFVCCFGCVPTVTFPITRMVTVVMDGNHTRYSTGRDHGLQTYLYPSCYLTFARFPGPLYTFPPQLPTPP